MAIDLGINIGAAAGGGGAPAGEAYTKAQSDARFAKKTDVETLGQKVSEVEDCVEEVIDRIGQFDKTTLTSSDFSNLAFDGTKFINTPSGYNAFVWPLNKGVSYSVNITRGTRASSFRIFSAKPEAGVNNTLVTGVNIGDTYTPPVTGYYGYVQFNIGSGYDSPIIEVNAIQEGISTQIRNLMSERMRVNKYSNLSFDGEKVAASTSSYNGLCIYVPANVHVLYIFGASGNVENCTGYTNEPKVGVYNQYRYDERTQKYKGKDFVRYTIDDNDDGLYVLITVSTNGLDLTKVSYQYNNQAFDDVTGSLIGKKILCLGDSITEFADTKGYNYPMYMQAMTGAQVYACGIGGTNLVRRGAIDPTTASGSYAALDIVSLAEAIYNNDFTAQVAAAKYLKDYQSDNNTAQVNTLMGINYDTLDYVVIMGGSNDWTRSSQVGENTDEGNPSTIKGAIRLICKYILQRNPKIKLVFMSNTPRYWSAISHSDWCTIRQNNNGHTHTDIVNAIEDAVKYNTCPFVDVYHNIGWNEFNYAEFYTINGRVDNAHPYSGFDVLAKFVINNIRFV